jgi:hypothetical protein
VALSCSASGCRAAMGSSGRAVCAAPADAASDAASPPPPPRYHAAMRRSLALAAVLVLAACNGPARPIIAKEAAAAAREPMTLRVRGVWDAIDDIADVTDPGVTHLLEVDVLDGPEGWSGRRLTLPYDEWAVGEPPPKRGTTVTASPARWVRGDGKSRGKAKDAWRAP